MKRAFLAAILVVAALVAVAPVSGREPKGGKPHPVAAALAAPFAIVETDPLTFGVEGPADYLRWVAVWGYDEAGEAISAQFLPVVWAEDGNGSAGPFAPTGGVTSRAYTFEYPATHTPLEEVAF